MSSRPEDERLSQSAHDEVRRELHSHIEEEVDRLVARGWDRAEAWEEVTVRMGSLSEVERECVRLEKQRRGREGRRRMWNAAIQDIRYGARALRHRPGFTIAAIVTIALGLGPATALFSVVDTVLLRPLPYPAPDELVRIGSTIQGGRMGPIPGPLFQDWQRDGVAPFTSAAAILVENAELPAEGGTPGRLTVGTVSSEFGPMMGIQVRLGRWLSPHDDRRGAERVTVLSHRIWSERWGSDPGIIGRPITLDGHPVTVVGVAPATFHPPEALGLSRTDLWVPLAQAKQDLDTHNNWFLRVIARLPTGVGEAEALSALQERSNRMITTYPLEDWAERDFALQTARLRDLTVGSSRDTLTPLILAVALLLLTASLDLAHLNLARGRDRRRELAVRGALGASRGRLVGQLVMESMLTGAAGIVLALVIAGASLELLKAFGPGNLPRLEEVVLDLRAMAATGTFLILSGLGFALLPAMSAVRGADSQVAGGTTFGSRLTRGGGNALVSLQLAFTLVLLASGGLLGMSYWNLLGVESGFRVDGVSVVHVTLRDRYEAREQREAAFEAIRQRLAVIPGVEAVGSAYGLPFGETGMGGSVVVEGRAVDPEGGRNFVRWGMSDAGYFSALGVSALPGGRLPDPDQYASGAYVAVVNEAYVVQYLSGLEPIGSRLQVGRSGDDAPWWEVVGVIPDFKQGRLDREASAEIFLPTRAAHYVFPTMEFVVRTAAGARVSADQLRDAVWDFDPNQPVAWVATLEDRVSGSIVAPRFHASLLALLAATALALSAAGVFGTVAYSVGRRRRELAIRRALGATAGSVRGHVVRGNFRWIAAGLGGGIAGAYPVTRSLEGMLFGIEPMSPAIFAAAAVLLMGIALTASYLPARSASRADPAGVLRE